MNNLLTGDENYHRPLLFVWQIDTICKRVTNPQLKKFDNNIYVRSSDTKADPLILWGPAPSIDCQAALESPEAVQKLVPEFSVKSKYFTGDIPLFKGRYLGNYQLLPGFPGAGYASLLPPEISKVLSLPKKATPYIGAYPEQ
jgi:hypothetical protein